MYEHSAKTTVINDVSQKENKKKRKENNFSLCLIRSSVGTIALRSIFCADSAIFSLNNAYWDTTPEPGPVENVAGGWEFERKQEIVHTHRQYKQQQQQQQIIYLHHRHPFQALSEQVG
jgi:hypothetical protein